MNSQQVEMLIQVIFGVVLFLAFCFGALILWWQRTRRQYWEKNGVSFIPGGCMFLGVLKEVFLYRKTFGEVLMDLYNDEKFKDEPITGVYLCHKPSLIIRDPEIIKNIHVKDFSNFMDRSLIADTDNLFFVKGDRWKIIRHKLSPVLTADNLKNVFLLINDVNKKLEEKLSCEIDDKPREYEMKDFSALYTMDTITTLLFGASTNCLQSPNPEFHKKAQMAAEFNLKRTIKFCVSLFFPEIASLIGFQIFPKETNDFLRSTLNHAMEERKKSGVKCNDLIDTLLAMKEEDTDFFSNEDTLVAQAAIFLLAGYETTSSAIAFALYELSQHQEIQEKLRKEIQAYTDKYESLQYETINEMEYLQSVVQETLRMYPSECFLSRVCLPTDGAGAYSLEPHHKFAIPRGMSIYIPVNAIHRDPKNYDNPKEFIPERFNAENWKSLNQSNFLAFGIGPRNCIGMQFGYLQVKLALITILRNYRVEATERTPKTISYDRKAWLLRSQEPLYMNLTRI